MPELIDYIVYFVLVIMANVAMHCEDEDKSRLLYTISICLLAGYVLLIRKWG